MSADTMDCGDDATNEHMLQALKAEDAPTITLRHASRDVANGCAGTP